jgi:imidazolonepropionase-like amidohydrolase
MLARTLFALAPGKLADLIAVPGNPPEDVRVLEQALGDERGVVVKSP